jgi:hypothetical protein
VLLALDSSGVLWIDFARRRCAEGEHPLFDAVKSVFSIHGVRFEPTRAQAAIDLPDVERSKLG